MSALSLSLVVLATPAWSRPAAPPAADAASTLSRDSERCRAQVLDACYDAIRWSPRDPALLVALGDALDRANRPAEAVRAYRRALALSPSMGGVAAKINAVEAKRFSRRPTANPPVLASAARGAAGKRFSNADPVAQSH